MGTGNGIDAGIMREISEYVNSGYWVQHEDAQTEIEKSFDRGVEHGFKEGLTQGKAARTGSAKARDEELHSAWQTGYDAAKADFASVQSDDSDRKRLLNELYHDRARLERVIDNLLDITGGFVDGLAEDLESEWIDERVHDSYSELIGAADQAKADHWGE